MITAVYPGSFDPITLGHLDIIQRASKLVDELVVGVLINSDKTYTFNVSEKVDMIDDAIQELGLTNVRVEGFNGLLIDYVNNNDIDIIIKGLRAVTDFEYELQMAYTNKQLSGNRVDTWFLPASLEKSFTSSSLVKEIARYNGDLHDFVTPYVEKKLQTKYRDKYEFEGINIV